ncbi:MAG TPA: hypothetical protein VFJ90_12785, partial [Candidatus Didemnitutus sp.]|nr:hypothetical protein [Candidatus Didemnitutus sp.]
NDQRTIVALAMQRMMAAGYRRIGFVMPRWWDDFVERAWSAGFLAEQLLLPPEDRIPILYFSTPPQPGRATGTGVDFSVSRNELSQWLDKHSPEVILSYGPFVKATLADLGLSIPKDIAYVETFLESPDGTTAGVHQNCNRVGELAIEVLAGQLNQHIYGIPSIPTATLVEGAWCDGSTLPPCKAAQTVKFADPAAAKAAPYYSRSRNFPRKVAV